MAERFIWGGRPGLHLSQEEALLLLIKDDLRALHFVEHGGYLLSFGVWISYDNLEERSMYEEAFEEMEIEIFRGH